MRSIAHANHDAGRWCTRKSDALQRLAVGWAFALAFRREVVASLDVSYTAATSLPPTRRCRVNGALLDELVFVTGLAPLLETNLRAEPRERLYATDASPNGACCCVGPITWEAWLTLYAGTKGTTRDWVGKEKNHRAACMMDAQPLHLWLCS